jgi:transmembrane sensor
MTNLTEKLRREELLKVAEQAAAWVIELEEAGPRERAACAAWLEESPLHAEMFLRAGAVDRLTELLSPGDLQALAQKEWPDDATAVIPLPGVERAQIAAGPEHAKQSSRPHFFALAASVLVALASAAWYETLGPGSWDTYKTPIGEQRVISLDDGSTIYVNTDSRIDVRYTDTARELRLRDGEALFKVVRDPQRPFQVAVGDTIVQAVGTQFNVYSRDNQTKVAVVEGSVQVFKRASAPSPAGTAGDAAVAPVENVENLSAGQSIHIGTDGAIEPPMPVSVTRVTAWRERRLVFEWQTLEEIAAEFNRYNRTPQIRVEGDEIRSRRYTAVFDADNPQTLLNFLSRHGQVEFIADGDNYIIRAR